MSRPSCKCDCGRCAGGSPPGGRDAIFFLGQMNLVASMLSQSSLSELRLTLGYLTT
jgi:hypothetical protein